MKLITLYVIYTLYTLYTNVYKPHRFLVKTITDMVFQKLRIANLHIMSRKLSIIRKQLSMV